MAELRCYTEIHSELRPALNKSATAAKINKTKSGVYEEIPAQSAMLKLSCDRELKKIFC